MDRGLDQSIDECLVMECQAGSTKAFEMLVSRWQKRLWRHASYLIGDSEGAWDVMQESWLAIVRGIGRLNDPGKFKGWAFRIVTNKGRDWMKNRQRRARSHAETAVRDVATSGSACSDNPSDVQSLLRRLPAQSRTVLSLYYLEGLSVADVARTLDIPEGTVKSRLHVARAEYKRLWQSLGGA